MGECEESKCSKPATKDWNGKKLCDDCYDKYRDQEEEMRNKFQI
jgi:hypothetical protein|tara:strand:+ start:299 stop:430 length:132 start_codon:yes stop_codon:yes gene_type:complete